MKPDRFVSSIASSVTVVLVIVCCTSARAAALEWLVQTLHEFSPTNGCYPASGLVQGPTGSFFGTTTANEVGLFLGIGPGKIFTITPSGSLTNIFAFNGTNGFFPAASLLFASDGNFYGTTYLGGVGYGSATETHGTAFKITPDGSFTTLLSFNGTNGSGPLAGLVQGSDGNLYGTTEHGGRAFAAAGDSGYGTVFKLSQEGALTTLVLFGGTNGCRPQGGLVQGSDGSFYGTTSAGGEGFDGRNNWSGRGTVFKITPDGRLTTLFRFNYASGDQPTSSLVLASDGDLLGTTRRGGVGGGSAFRITTDGVLRWVTLFDESIGGTPSGLMRGTDGNAYGTTIQYFGPNSPITPCLSFGSLFKITPAGGLSTLACFSNPNSSGDKTRELVGNASLVQGADGNFYGTRDYDYGTNWNSHGCCGFGTVFRVVQRPEITGLTQSNSQMTLRWTAFSGGNYRVETTSSLAAPSWIPLIPEFTTTGPVASVTNDTTGAAQRFYRIHLLP